MNVSAFLFPTGFWDNQIYITNSFNKSLSLFISEITFLLFFVPIKFVSRNNNNKIISESFGSFQKIDMSIMQQIKCTVCYYSFHSAE